MVERLWFWLKVLCTTPKKNKQNKIQKKLPNPEKSNVITQLSHQKINVVFYNFNIDKKEDLNTIKETLNMKKLKKSNIKKFGFPKVVDNYLNSHS